MAVGHVVVDEQDAAAVDDRAGRPGPFAAVEVEPADHDVRAAPRDRQRADDAGARARERLEGDRPPGLAGAADRHGAAIGALAQAADLAGSQRVHQPLHGAVARRREALAGARGLRVGCVRAAGAEHHGEDREGCRCSTSHAAADGSWRAGPLEQGERRQPAGRALHEELRPLEDRLGDEDVQADRVARAGRAARERRCPRIARRL